MGQGDAAPESRRAEPFAFEQCFGHLARIETERARRQVADIRKERLLRIDRNVRSEEHTSELQSLMRISYAVFCLKKKNIYLYANRICPYRLHHQTHIPTLYYLI